MVVAISLAFTSTFVVSLDFNAILSFVFTNTIVIWFWWGYVMDRLLYPPTTTRFPFIDILLLILISLMPFALKQGSILYVSGVVGALISIWALMIRGIIRENSDSISEEVKSELSGEVKQRVILGSLFIIVAALSYFSNLVGINVFVGLVLFVMAWNAIVSLRTKRRRQNKK